jgi:hypothetical protein
MDYMFYIRAEAKVTKGTCNKYIGIKIYQHDDITKMLNDPFKRPYYLEPVGFFENGSLVLITEGEFTVSNTRVTFIKRPNQVKNGSVYPTLEADVDCELSEYTHKEIVALACQVAMENIESQRLASNVPMVDKTME